MKIKKEFKNKKGFLLGELSLKLIIAVLCILILITLGVKLFGMFSKQNDVKQAENNLKLIEEKIAYLNSPDYTQDFLYVIIFPPEKTGWFITSFGQGHFPSKQCNSKNFKTCLCMCKEDSTIQAECISLTACVGFEQEILTEREFKIEEIIMIQGSTNNVNCNYWYEGQKWNNNAASSCLDLSGESYEGGILIIRSSHDKVSFDGKPVDILQLTSSQQELKIIKESSLIKDEIIIKIKQTDR